MENTFEKYFLAANSCEGFCEHFTDCYSLKKGWRAYIIKGGPGTGKSSFMKYVALKAKDRGMRVKLCVCSSDPNSLDAIIIEDIKTVILDGTAPHIVEPKNPGVCEEILNLGQFWDGDILRHNKERICEIVDKNKSLHKLASKYLYACGELIRDNLKLSKGITDREKVLKFTQNLCKKYIPAKSGEGSEWMRFVGGVTPVGVVSYLDNLSKFYKKKIIIEDKYGGASGLMMEKIREHAIESGYEIITLKNPFLPSELTDHILIPQLSLMFATENEYNHIKSDERRIHNRRFCEVSAKKQYRGRFLFNSSVARQLLVSACETLGLAKKEHDRLERYYIKAMDFEALTDYATRITEKILSE
ncbi:MAG: hypothetical protein IJZ75_06065 [Clostridia bacterium]|nr:hypothetical protein [Clostridia bacterium]